MQKFATLCAVAIYSADALGLEAEKGTLEMYVDNFEFDVQSMPQGKGKSHISRYWTSPNLFSLWIGQDHTLWSWDIMVGNGNGMILFYESEASRTT